MNKHIGAVAKWLPICTHYEIYLLNENIWIAVEIPLKFVPDKIDKLAVLVPKYLAWRRTGDKALSEKMMAYNTDTYMRHSASMD